MLKNLSNILFDLKDFDIKSINDIIDYIKSLAIDYFNYLVDTLGIWLYVIIAFLIVCVLGLLCWLFEPLHNVISAGCSALWNIISFPFKWIIGLFKPRDKKEYNTKVKKQNDKGGW